MDKKLLKPIEHTNETGKIDCNNIKKTPLKIEYTQWGKYVLTIKQNGKKTTVKYKYPTSEVHGDKYMLDKLLLDARTYICCTNKCSLHYSRSHKRMTIHNINKIKKHNNDNYLKIVQITADKIIQLLASINEVTIRRKIPLLKNIAIKLRLHKEKKTKSYIENCSYCLNPKLKGLKHTHFIKSNNTLKLQIKSHTNESYKAIEETFDTIDNIAKENSMKILQQPNISNKRKEMNPNNIRMTYGDLNYIGSNKVIFYFDRGYRGNQIFTNSMEPIERQPKHKDIVVIDEIVFTSNCKCDSIRQHKEMFPHYRVTCAVGLTCPARLTKHERIIYARTKNATTESFTTARQMLIRYW
jgi:hypothetical protein